MTHIEKVELWEKGFAKYIEVTKELDKYAGVSYGRPGLTRKLNDSIRMMARADYQGLMDLGLNQWSINCALKNFNFDELQ